MACLLTPRMRMPSMMAWPPMLVLKAQAPLFSAIEYLLKILVKQDATNILSLF
jgi:hypothetical protein